VNVAMAPSVARTSTSMNKRITTPARAVKNGSDYLVIGRPIRDAADCREAARRISEEIEAVI